MTKLISTALVSLFSGVALAEEILHTSEIGDVWSGPLPPPSKLRLYEVRKDSD
ncbi:MAG: hypothetical protein HY706_00340 [Candidatus Hydrogenedentes bacterium]|nr:hypothetical protein [Candidatus Hydrogenedentota bacterium]